MAYYHSVTLDTEKCKGCTNCIQRCPTEAIRVRGGKAKIIKDRCIDCGECIRVCSSRAKRAVTDSFEALNGFEYNIALPAPALYGQFGNDITTDKILSGLLEIGFDDVFEVARAAEYVSEVTKKLLNEGKLPTPAISSACPAVVRLISVRFPSLLDNVVNILEPMEVAASMARREARVKTGLPDEKIGVFFITPCPAKMTSIKVAADGRCSAVSGAISVNDVYVKLLGVLKNVEVKPIAKAGLEGIAWARRGGETAGLKMDDCIVVDGIENVIKILSAIEDNKLPNVKFAEFSACSMGCVGGALNVVNPYVSVNNIRKIALKTGTKELADEVKSYEVIRTEELQPSKAMKFDNDFSKAMEMMEQVDKMCEKLPQLDCGACGAPNCRALAEDIVRGYAKEYDCIFRMGERIKFLSENLTFIAQQHCDGTKLSPEEFENLKELSGELYDLEQGKQSGYDFSIAEMERY